MERGRSAWGGGTDLEGEWSMTQSVESPRAGGCDEIREGRGTGKVPNRGDQRV